MADYDSDCDYDNRPEAGRVRQSLDSDESDNERPSGPRRPPPFLNDDDDDDEALLTIVDNGQRDRSSSSSAPAAAAVNPIRQPTAFAAPNPTTTTTTTTPVSSSPTFYHHKDKTKTPIRVPGHAAASTSESESAHVTGTGSTTGGTPSMLQFSVEGYVNTPELSAGRGGGLSQGLPATGPYKSLFRAGSRSRSRSESRASGNHHNHHHQHQHYKTGAAPPTSSLHVLAEAAQSPEALSPISRATASPQPTPTSTSTHAPTNVPAPTSKKRARKPSPLIESASPASPVETLDPISATQSSPPVASTNASSSSSSQSHVVVDPSPPPPRHPRAKSGNGGSGTSGKGKQCETLRPGEPGEQRCERGSLPLGGRQLSEPLGIELHESESAVRDRPRYEQKNDNRNGGESLKEPSPADHLSYDHAEGDDYFPSYVEAGPSGASDIAYEGGQSLSPSRATVNHDPASAHIATGKAPSLADSRSVTPGTKPRMITLLIEDRRHGTDELAEVHVPLKAAGEGHLWADAKDVCVALQSGPSRIDGPAKVFTMRGRYRQTFLRISVDGEETTQSANLKVETDKTLSVVVEGMPDPHVTMPAPFFNSNPSSLVSTGPGAHFMDTVNPLTPVSNRLGLDGMHTTPSEMGQWSGGARKRKRETSLGQVQQLPFGSPAVPNISTSTLHEQHRDSGRPWKSRRNNPVSSSDGGGGGYMSDSPPAAYRSQRVQQRTEQTHSGFSLDRSGYESEQPPASASVVRARPGPSSGYSSDRKMSSLLRLPPAPMEGSQRMHDKVASFLQDKFMEDALDWNEFCRDRAHVESLSNAGLLRIYWFAQGRLETWVGSRLAKQLNNKKVEIGHVLDALGVTDDWYRECNETLSLVIAYGERGERWECHRAVAACRDRAPPKSRHSSHGAGSSGGPTDLLMLLREVHEEYCRGVRGRNSGQGRASSGAEST